MAPREYIEAHVHRGATRAFDRRAGRRKSELRFKRSRSKNEAAIFSKIDASFSNDERRISAIEGGAGRRLDARGTLRALGVAMLGRERPTHQSDLHASAACGLWNFRALARLTSAAEHDFPRARASIAACNTGPNKSRRARAHEQSRASICRKRRCFSSRNHISLSWSLAEPPCAAE